MATTRLPIAGNASSSSHDPSRRRGAESKELPAALRPQSDARSRGSKQTDRGESDLRCCAFAETEELPRIILVSGADTLMPELSQVLHPCPLDIRILKSCREAAHEIERCRTADVIFTDLHLPDGNWKNVLQIAIETSACAEVILVSRFVDVRLYLDALEAGAFDLVVPPFHTVELGYIIVNAIHACSKQRTEDFAGHLPEATAV